MDIDSATGLVYAVNNSSVAEAVWCGKTPVSKPEGRDTLSIVDPSFGGEIAAVPTDGSPVWPWVSVENDEVYVAASRTGSVAVHARGTGERWDSINVGGLRHDLTLDHGSGLLIVSNTNDQSQEYLAVVDIAARSVGAHRKVIRFLHKITVDFEAGVAYVVSVESGTVSVVDTANGQVTGTFDTSSQDDAFKGAAMIALSRSTGRLCATKLAFSEHPFNVHVIDVKTGELMGRIAPFISLGLPVWGVAVDEPSQLLYVTLGDSRHVGAADLDTLQPVALIEVDDCPWAIKLDTARGMGFVTGVTNGTLSVIDLKKVEEALGR